MAKKFAVEYRMEIGAILAVVGALVTIIAVVGVFLKNSMPSTLSGLTDIATKLGNWNLWLLLLGPSALILGAWWVYDHFKKVKKLEKYLSENSKSKFVRNIEDIQYLGWSLPQRYEDMVLEKMDEFRIKL